MRSFCAREERGGWARGGEGGENSEVIGWSRAREIRARRSGKRRRGAPPRRKPDKDEDARLVEVETTTVVGRSARTRGRGWVGRVGVTHVLLVLRVERGDDRSRGGGVVAVRLDVEIVGGLGADLAPRGGRGLLLEQAHHGACGWGTRREDVTFGAVASHAETFARGELRDEDGVRWGASVARWEGEAPRARETPRVRRQTQRLARWDVKAQGGVTKKRARGVGRRRRAGARDRRTRIRAAREARGVPPRAFRAIPPRRAARDDRNPRPAGVSIARHFAVTLAEVPSRAQPRTSQSIVERRLLASSTRVSHQSQRRDRQARSRSTYARNVPRHSLRAPSMRPVTRGAGVPSTRTNAEREKRHLAGVTSVLKLL